MTSPKRAQRRPAATAATADGDARSKFTMEKAHRQFAVRHLKGLVNMETAGFPPVIAIVGPTAVGKSRLALQLAVELGAVIVSADSRMVYRYMDIGTDKPSLEQRANAPHYLIDVVAPDELYSAQRYREESTRVLQRVGATGGCALVAGGTGFYLRALLDRPSYPVVPPDPALRTSLRALAEEHGIRTLHERLCRLDPSSAARIHPNNLSRLIRAIEIVETTGVPVPPATSTGAVPALWLGLAMDRSRLRERSDLRIRAQIRDGLIEETRLLLEMGYGPDSPGLQGFGYRQVVGYLQGHISLDDAIKAYETATHQYIRRQSTWFRSDRRITWIPAGDDAFALALPMVRSWLERNH